MFDYLIDRWTFFWVVLDHIGDHLLGLSTDLCPIEQLVSNSTKGPDISRHVAWLSSLDFGSQKLRRYDFLPYRLLFIEVYCEINAKYSNFVRI